MRRTGAEYAYHRMPTGAERPVGFVMSLYTWEWTKHIQPTPYLDPESSADPATYLMGANAYNGRTSAQLARRTAGTISGTFAVNGILKANARIVLISRSTGQVIRTVLTDINGFYSFKYINLDTNNYVVLGIDPTNTERAEAYDRVYPL